MTCIVFLFYRLNLRFFGYSGFRMLHFVICLSGVGFAHFAEYLPTALANPWTGSIIIVKFPVGRRVKKRSSTIVSFELFLASGNLVHIDDGLGCGLL